jgi:hypothetical protein
MSHKKPSKRSQVTTSGFITTYLSGADGVVTFADVRHWVRTCETLGVKDDTELLECLLTVDINVTKAESIECGVCTQKDVLVSNHDCPGYSPWQKPLNKKKKSKKGI